MAFLRYILLMKHSARSIYRSARNKMHHSKLNTAQLQSGQICTLYIWNYAYINAWKRRSDGDALHLCICLRIFHSSHTLLIFNVCVMCVKRASCRSRYFKFSMAILHMGWTRCTLVFGRMVWEPTSSIYEFK